MKTLHTTSKRLPGMSWVSPRHTFERPRGFTLLELMVVVIIITIIAVLVLPRYNDFKNANAVRNAAQMAALDLRTMRQQAITLEQEHGIHMVSATKYQTGAYDTSGNLLTSNPTPKDVDLNKVYKLQVSIFSPSGTTTNITFKPGTRNLASDADWAWTAPMKDNTRWMGGDILGFRSGRYSIKIAMDKDGRITVPDSLTVVKDTQQPSPTPTASTPP